MYIEKDSIDNLLIKDVGKDKDIIICLSPYTDCFVCAIKKGDFFVNSNGRFLSIDNLGISVHYNEYNKVISVTFGKKYGEIVDRIPVSFKTAYLDNGVAEYFWWEYYDMNGVHIVNKRINL
jgi:hypothetical protein